MPRRPDQALDRPALDRPALDRPSLDRPARDTPSRRALIRLGAAAATAPLWRPAQGRAALSAQHFKRGVNAWPWFAFPVETPPAGAAYAIWPPFVAARPVPTSADLRRLAVAGFDFVRIPVNPAPFLALMRHGPQDQFARLVAMLVEAVERADAAGLGVVVNLQPDAIADYTPEDLYGATASPARFAAYVALVARLATVLGALKIARLALEPVNEPPQRVARSFATTVSDEAAAAKDWAGKQVALLAAARARARDLTLVATGGSGSGIGGLVLLDPKPLIAAFDPLIFTFHFYEPFLFSHQGAPWLARAEPLYRWLNAVPWPGSAGSMDATMAAVRARMAADPGGASVETRRKMEDAIRLQLTPYFEPSIDRRYFTSDGANGNQFFATLAGWMTRHALGPERVFMGEFGALKTTDTVSPVTGGPYVAAHAADRARYVRDLRMTAEARGFGWAVWTLFNPGMGIMDEASRALDPAMMEALGLTML